MPTPPPICAARILVVDDDVAARLMAREALEQAGFIVEEAEHGHAAVEQFRAVAADLVLLDVMMPEMDGFAACAGIRALPEGTHTPILMMTGLDDVDSINRAYEAGATDFTTKPINFSLLPHRIRYLLRAKHTADELRASEALLANAQRIARLGHFEWDMETGHIHGSAQMHEIFGVPPGESIDSQDTLMRFVFPEDRDTFVDMIQSAIRDRRGYSVEHRIMRRDGSVRTVYQEGEFTPPSGKRGLCLAGTIQDVTERRRLERQVHHLAFYDGITGLPNRTLMKRHLAQALTLAKRHGRVVAVLALDIDHFSRVNDTLGHDAGNELLKIVARRLIECIRGSDGLWRVEDAEQPVGDTVARIGGDEFVIVLTEINNAEDAAVVARRIREVLMPSCLIHDTEVNVSASIGISAFPIDSLDADSLLKQADAAMHHAKSHGRDRYQFSTSSINARAFERFSLETNLRKAMSAAQFELFYQPKVRVSSRHPVGMEALVRWRHPDLGLVSPAEFIPVAEETGLIVPLGEWILGEACRQLKQWQREGLPPLSCSVNLSAVQFRDRNLRDTIARSIRQSGVDPAFLELELTESLLMDDRDASVALMHDLKAIGLALSIDDFGTGYSSLSYLKRFPINALKVDQSFVRDVTEDADDAAIVGAIVALAHSLRLKVVAEGVETEEQMRFLTDLQCDEVQGYYFSRPLTAADFAGWVQRAGPPPYRTIKTVSAG